jgi:hypothetical protein
MNFSFSKIQRCGQHLMPGPVVGSISSTNRVVGKFTGAWNLGNPSGRMPLGRSSVYPGDNRRFFLWKDLSVTSIG